MPELPDVEVNRRYLASTALHQRIARINGHSAWFCPSCQPRQAPVVPVPLTRWPRSVRARPGTLRYRNAPTRGDCEVQAVRVPGTRPAPE